MPDRKENDLSKSQQPQALRDRLLQAAADQLEEIRHLIGPKLMLRAMTKSNLANPTS